MGLFIQLEMCSYGSCWQVINSEPSHTQSLGVCGADTQRFTFSVFVNLVNIVYCKVQYSKLKQTSVTDVCIAYLTESSVSLLVGACECADMHVVFSGLCVPRTSTHTKDTWPSITVCLPLRQQMFQPCLNSLAVWNQTVPLGPWGLTHLYCSQHPIIQLITD